MENKRDAVFAVVFMALIFVAIIIICARSAEVNVDAADEQPDRVEIIEKTIIVEKPVYITKDVVYTPVEYTGETIITPDIIMELPDFERCCAIMAQMLFGEIGNGSDEAVAAVAWCVCNRAADDSRTPDAVIEKVVKPNQFYGYNEKNPVDERLYNIARDVLIQWMMEPYTNIGVNRVLPEDYKWFGGDGYYNTFRNSYVGGERITVK